MSHLDAAHRLGSLPLSNLSYVSLSHPCATRRPVSRFHLLELIFLSVAISGGCLCYLTIYYHLTSTPAYDSPPGLVPLVTANRELENNTGNGAPEAQTKAIPQLDTSADANWSQLGDEADLAFERSKSISAQQHVSEFLSDHVQLLAVKAKHRLEVVKREMGHLFLELQSQQIQIQNCNNLTIFVSASSPLYDPFFFQPLEHLPVTGPSQCDVLLLEGTSTEHDNSTLVALSPSRNAFIDYFNLLEQILPSHVTLCNLFTAGQSFSAFQQSNPPLYSPLCFNENSSTRISDILSQSVGTLDQSYSYIESNGTPSLNSPSPALSELTARRILDFQLFQSPNQSIRIRSIVLVTSVNPLRAFLYDDQFDQHEVLATLNHSQRSELQIQVEKALVQSLLLLDIADQLIKLPEIRQHANESIGHFQLLAFDLQVSQSLDQMYIFDIFNYLNGTFNSTKQKRVLSDSIELLQRPTSADTFHYLQAQLEALLEQDELGLQGVSCHQSHRACLSPSDLTYLLNTLAQASSTKFSVLFPLNGEHSAIYQLEKLFDDILIFLAEKERQAINGAKFEYQTERMHSVVTLLDFGKPKRSTSSFHDGTIMSSEDHHFFDLTNLNSAYHGSTQLAREIENGDVLRNCSTNFEQLSHLAQLDVLLPDYVRLDPPFDASDRMHFQVNGPTNYGDLLLSLNVSVAHCEAWVKIENQILFQSGILNFTLGLGVNTITINLVTSSALLLSTYTISIHRLTREEQFYQPVPDLRPLQICSLIQDCSMQVYPDEPCGLQPTGVTVDSRDDYFADNWVSKLQGKDICLDGAAVGRWLVPCITCSRESTCSWNHLEWLPYNCRYQLNGSRKELLKCLHKKHILLVGDSTNRGIMHYILERLNGSLTEADKTHDLKRYTLKSAELDVTVTFAYYPKFWISLPQRPSFTSVMHELLNELAIKDNSDGSNLVVIVGGVQWIAKKHLTIIEEQFKLFNLPKAKIVIKTLGSGFHQPVSGVHYMPLIEQRKLAYHNEQLVAEARLLKLGIVDTFNKTIALYRDFYPGKCACHFHKIVKHQEYGHTPPMDMQQYHVEGRLNRLYSEILLSQICFK